MDIRFDFEQVTSVLKVNGEELGYILFALDMLSMDAPSKSTRNKAKEIATEIRRDYERI